MELRLKFIVSYQSKDPLMKDILFKLNFTRFDYAVNVFKRFHKNGYNANISVEVVCDVPISMDVKYNPIGASGSIDEFECDPLEISRNFKNNILNVLNTFIEEEIIVRNVHEKVSKIIGESNDT